jgi:hypothetical protein
VKGIAEKMDASLESALCRMRHHEATVTNKDFPGVVESLMQLDYDLDNIMILNRLMDKALLDAEFIIRRSAPPSTEV